MPGMTAEQEQQILDRNHQSAEPVETTTGAKPQDKSDVQPMWVTLKQAHKLSGIPKSSFDNRRREGYFHTYKIKGVRSLRLKYTEFIDDCLNLMNGGKPTHEPDEFLPPRRRDA